MMKMNIVEQIKPLEYEDLEAGELKRETQSFGCCLISDENTRHYTNLHGKIRSILISPLGAEPRFQAELYDGSGVVTLIWLGRREVKGIEVDQHITVHGHIGFQNKDRIIYNPKFELSQ